MPSTEQAVNKVVLGQRTADRPDAFDEVAVGGDGVGGESGSQQRLHIVQSLKARDCLFDSSNTGISGQLRVSSIATFSEHTHCEVGSRGWRQHSVQDTDHECQTQTEIDRHFGQLG